MKIISFLLFTIISGYNEVLYNLQKTSFGQSLQQMILLQFQEDETKILPMLQKIDEALIQEQQIDSQFFQEELQNCDLLDLQTQISKLNNNRLEQIEKLKFLNNSQELNGLKMKQNELIINQEQVSFLENEMQQNNEIFIQHIKECDDLLELLQYFKFQYEKKVLFQKNKNQRDQLTDLVQEDLRFHLKQIGTKMNQSTLYKTIEIFIEQLNQKQNQEKIIDILSSITKIINQDKETQKEIYITQNESLKQELIFYQNYQHEIQTEISNEQNYFDQIQNEIIQLQNQIQIIDEFLYTKQQIQQDKINQCKNLEQDFYEYVQFRQEQRDLLSQIINLIKSNLNQIKKYYTENGYLR